MTEWTLGNGDYLASIATLDKPGERWNECCIRFPGHDGQDNHHPPGEDYALGLLEYDTQTGNYTPRPLFWSCALVFRFIRPGAKRIQLVETSPAVEALAFYHPQTHAMVITGYTDRSIQINGTLNNLLPIDRFENHRVTAAGGIERQADVAVNGNNFAVEIGEDEVFTLVFPGSPSDEEPDNDGGLPGTPGNEVPVNEDNSGDGLPGTTGNDEIQSDANKGGSGGCFIICVGI